MYEELIKKLREKAEGFDYDGWVETATLLEESADTIEELQAIAESNMRNARTWADESAKAVTKMEELSAKYERALQYIVKEANNAQR